MDNRFSMKGSNAVVTGATRGIGLAIARGFLESWNDLAKSLTASLLLERVHLFLHKSPDLLEEGLGCR